MKPHVTLAAATVIGLAAVAGQFAPGAADASENKISMDVVRAEFTRSGEARRPDGWREWVFIGTPLTPNALNGGEAPFPEFHNVYIEPSAYKVFEATGKFPEGTQIAKELVMIRAPHGANEDGSTDEASGTGYFQGEFAGLELTVKDNKRYPNEPGGWAYFSFGHSGEPYAATAKAFPTESCNACHQSSADTDFVFTQFYPVLRAAMKK